MDKRQQNNKVFSQAALRRCCHPPVFTQLWSKKFSFFFFSLFRHDFVKRAKYVTINSTCFVSLHCFLVPPTRGGERAIWLAHLCLPAVIAHTAASLSSQCAKLEEYWAVCDTSVSKIYLVKLKKKIGMISSVGYYILGGTNRWSWKKDSYITLLHCLSGKPGCHNR